MSEESSDSKLAYEPPDVERPASAAPTEQQLEKELVVSPGHDPYAALRLRDYRFYSLGWLISVIGQQVQSIAVGWDIYHRPGMNEARGALALGMVGLVQALPVMALALPAGHIADRFDKRRLVMISQLLAMVCSLGLALLSYKQGSITLMYVVLTLSAIAQAIGWPARHSLLPQVVPPEAFNNAVTWNSSFFHIASMVGPTLGGVIVLVSLPLAYVFDAICGLTFAIFLLRLHVRPAKTSGESATWNNLVAGVRFVRKTKIILATITLDLFAVLLGGATYLLPVFAEKLGVGAVGYGWLRASPAIGAFIAALLIAHMPPMKHAGRSMLMSVAAFGAATIVFGLSRSFVLSFVMLALTGAFDNVSVVVRHTLVQMLPPESMRGRVAAVNIVFIGASNELGGLESGVTAWLFGPVLSVVGGGIGTLLVVAAVALIWPQVVRFGSLKDARPIEEAEELAPAASV